MPTILYILNEQLLMLHPAMFDRLITQYSVLHEYFVATSISSMGCPTAKCHMLILINGASDQGHLIATIRDEAVLQNGTPLHKVFKLLAGESTSCFLHSSVLSLCEAAELCFVYNYNHGCR
jgi:hypothetical protein